MAIVALSWQVFIAPTALVVYGAGSWTVLKRIIYPVTNRVRAKDDRLRTDLLLDMVEYALALIWPLTLSGFILWQRRRDASTSSSNAPPESDPTTDTRSH